MKKSFCLLLVVMLTFVITGWAMALENSDVVVADTDLEELPKNVQTQLEVAMMALGLATTDPVSPPAEGEAETVDTAKMEELAERHAFIAWAHYNNIPASRKLQDQVFGQTVKIDETDATLWESIKENLGDLAPEEYRGFLEGIAIPEGLVIDGKANWGQFQKNSSMKPLSLKKTSSSGNGKALGKDKEKEGHGNKGGNKGGNNGGSNNGNGNGNSGGNGGGNGGKNK